MNPGKKMTPTEERLFRESVIREYKAKHEKPRNSHTFYDFLRIVRRFTPLNILLGIIASILLVYLKGWEVFFQLVLTGIIWITIISTAIAAISKKK